MENATWLDVVIKRLRFFTRPLPLASAVGALLLGVFVWDYLRHPEWFGAFEEDGSGPNEEANLTGLTSEERAAAAGLDSLTVLMNELGVEPGNNPRIQALSDEDSADQSSLLDGALALSQANNNSSSSIAPSPFADYLQQYQFGRNSLAPESSPNDAGGQFGSIRTNSFGNPTATTEQRSINPLAAALLNQSGLSGAVSSQSNSPLANELRSLSNNAPQVSETETEMTEKTTGENEQITLPPGEFSSQITTIPGVDFRVLPTLPQMSPPPGTTGYTPPASLDLMPPLPGSTNSTSRTAATSNSGLTGTSLGTEMPNIDASNVDVSNGYVTPYAPTGAGTTTAPVTPAVPQPFTAPRAPGVYTGNGYINTFANPSSPPTPNANGN